MTEINYPGGVMNYFHYDALLRRFAVEESSGLSYFTWDANGMNLLCERDASGSVTTYYTHGYSPVSGIGTLVAAKRLEAGATYYQYPVYDHRGSVVRLLDENGTPTAYYEYDAWGNELEDNVISGTASNRFRYQSNWIKLKDSPFPLYLSSTRLEAPEWGRFLGRDATAGLGGNYDYCDANPVVHVDADGHASAAAPGTKPQPSPKPKPQPTPTPKPKLKPQLKRKPDKPPRMWPVPSLDLKGENLKMMTIIQDGSRFIRRVKATQEHNSNPDSAQHLLTIHNAAKLHAWHAWANGMWDKYAWLSGTRKEGDYEYHDDVVNGILALKVRADLAWKEEMKRRRKTVRGDKCCCLEGVWDVIYTGGGKVIGGAGPAGGAGAVFWEATCRLEPDKKMYGYSLSAMGGAGAGGIVLPSGGTGIGTIRNAPVVKPGMTFSTGWTASYSKIVGVEAAVAWRWGWQGEETSTLGGSVGLGGAAGVTAALSHVTRVDCD